MPHATTLRPVDLLLNEEHLLSQAAQICPFRSGYITFPRDIPKGMAQGGTYRPVSPAGEDKLFIPLTHHGRLLGVLFLEGSVAEPDPLWLQALAPYMERCLEALVLAGQKRSDLLTGLLQQEALLEDLGREIELIAENALASSRETEPEEQGYRGEVALLALQIPEMPWICENRGYRRSEDILLRLARELAQCCPASCPAARLDNHRLGVMLPGTGPASIRKTAERIQSRLQAFSCKDPVTGEDLPLSVDMGLTFYPRDLFGPAASFPPQEQARVLLANALRALQAASSRKGQGTLFFFSSILTEGGRIRNILTGDRILVDLGRKDRAREGQIFAVHTPSGGYYTLWPAESLEGKAEIMLIDTGEESSLAQVLHRSPGTEIAPGDGLIHRPHPGESSLHTEHVPPQESARSGLLSLPHFLSLWRHRCREEEAFCLVLLRIQSDMGQEASGSPERLLDRLEEILPSGGLAGSYGSNRFILYLPGTGPERAKEMLQDLAHPGQQDQIPAFRGGIGYYPCLNYTRLDVTETTRNALEHAELLSGNAVAVFDSLSLTVSADRHYARGDLAEAITEYQQALLLDPENLLARNSLAICHAHLGRTTRAQQEFQNLLARDPENVMALYNLGCLSLKMEELQSAEQYFQRCLQLEPQQHFCLIRQGRIRERLGDEEGARDCYLRANRTPQGSRYAYKHLARLDYRQGDRRSARDNLQKAVQANPSDAEALHLMARIYLDAKEDPELVESLAKRSYSLRPDLEEHVRLLEEILISRGKREEAATLRPGASE
ncbi:MAG: tetratricopeptide repeat protein [Desulfohalobiaceae bacterium]|nr:tetratricopeptide repeat protein [Desulfohalobiaceae bacterium]